MNDSSASKHRPRFPLRPPEALLSVVSVLAGVFLPAFCFLLAAGGSPDAPDWQSGQYDDYASLLLGGNTTWVFYPFLAYSVLCLFIAVAHPATASRRFVIRLGVYSGVILALQYTIVLGMVLLDVHYLKTWRAITNAFLGIPLLSLVSVAVPAVGWLLLWIIVRLWQRHPRAMGLLLAAAVLLLMGMTLAVGISDAMGGDLGELLGPIVLAPFGLLIFGSLISAPTWAAAVYAYQSVRLLTLKGSRLQIKLWQFLAVFFWIAAYLAAWRAAILLALEAYAQLPVEPPDDCYIATAAARGHPRFVGSHEVACRDGSTRRVNLQLAYFKCGELVLRVVAPRFHRAIRRIYDAMGPLLSRLLLHKVAADITYLAFKPLEWTTRLFLRAAVGDLEPLARRMYG
jgi:hypothetical protein